MSDIFTILQTEEEEHPNEKGMALGLHLQIGDRGLDCPLSKTCRSEEEWVEVVASIQENLDRVLEEGKKKLGGPSPATELGIQPGMSGREMWGILSRISDENEFVACFNSLEDEKRIQVADHVLTECNVFSGKAATFSARYNTQTTLME